MLAKGVWSDVGVETQALFDWVDWAGIATVLVIVIAVWLVWLWSRKSNSE